jgi:hypothetical protein
MPLCGILFLDKISQPEGTVAEEDKCTSFGAGPLATLPVISTTDVVSDWSKMLLVNRASWEADTKMALLLQGGWRNSDKAGKGHEEGNHANTT